MPQVSDADAVAPPAAPAAVGDVIARRDRYSRDDIVAFALACRDANPLHRDGAAAERSSFGELIASGQHTSSMLLGLATSHLTRAADGGAREVLVLHVNFAFRGPVFADENVSLRWQVAEIAWNDRLQGHVLQLTGQASTARSRPALVARASLLVKRTPRAGPAGDARLVTHDDGTATR
jgi:acyl dehydratase